MKTTRTILSLALLFLAGCSADVTSNPPSDTVPGGCPAYRLDSNMTGTVAVQPGPQWMAVTFDTPAQVTAVVFYAKDGAALPVMAEATITADGEAIGFSSTWSAGLQRFGLSDNLSTQVRIEAERSNEIASVSVECRSK